MIKHAINKNETIHYHLVLTAKNIISLGKTRLVG
ncbi:MAG: hypothetical protein ACI97K_002540 [Glaciecola sp.]|jgi:uncharacterized protein YrrD